MTKILFILLLVTSYTFADITWMSTYEDAKAQALKEKKHVIVMLSKDGCNACSYMDDVVLKDKKVIKIISDNFIGVHLDIHKDKIPEDFTYIGMPTFYFTYASGENIVDRVTGASDTQKFMLTIKDVLGSTF